jgi:two-component system, LytTR family, response regulator
MIRAVIVDDEMHCRKTLTLLLEKYCQDVQVVAQCGSAAEGVEAINKLKPELVFLDIEMPGMNGFEMLEQFITLSFAVIFTTSFDQYAIKAFHYSALDYLLKPIESKELIEATNKVKNLKQLPYPEQFQMLLQEIRGKDNPVNKIALPTHEGYELIAAPGIIRCEANDNYTFVYLKDRQKITVCRTLKDVGEQLQRFNFFLRVHHSFIVNLNEVSRYVRGEGGYLIMSDSSTVSVSRSRKDALLDLF